MRKTIRIWWLKRQARRLYLQIASRYDLSCGAYLTEFIRPDVVELRRRFNAKMQRLAEIDPAAAKVVERSGRL